MNKIKLNKIGNSQLTNSEKMELRGGENKPQQQCNCGCCYVDSGGSSVEDNGKANREKNLNSPITEKCAIHCIFGPLD